MQLYLGLICPDLIYCISVSGASNKNVFNPLPISQDKLERFVVQIEWIALDHYLFHWKYYLFKMCITVRFVIIITNIFQGMKKSRSALKVPAYSTLFV